MIKKYLILGGLVVAIVGAAFWFAGMRDSYPGADLPEAVVELTEEGFSPKDLTVLKGQTVTFKTSRGKDFWPASDLHPTHGIYPEFDPLEPVAADKSWGFRFDKVGEWRYHDHLFPYYRGTIKVIKGDDKQVDSGGCENMEEEKKIQCWDDLVREAVRTKGVGYSVHLLAELYSDAQFAVNCHVFAHTIGGEAYFEFKKNNKIDISPEMNYCGFGFYHGFMETLLAKGESIQFARDLCAYMDKQLNNPSGYAGGACFHGIGHGLVDGSDKRAWGNAQALLEPGLELCDKVAVTAEEHYRCYSGAFNSISIAYSSEQWGLVNRPEDPLKLCREQKEQYKKACYSDMAVALMDAVSNDLAKAVKFIEPIKELPYANTAMKNAAGLLARPMVSRGFDYTNVIETCKTVQDRLRAACFRGFGAALVEFGEPGKEYARAFEFCGNAALNGEEKLGCFTDALSVLSASVDAEQLDVICGKVEENLRYLCKS
jgi:hypothetical protein